MNERRPMFQLRRYHTNESIFSFYDNYIENEVGSKWAIVRQRLPDILALSTDYKPTNIRTQLLLLIALMNKQVNQIRELNNYDFNTSLTHIPTNVIVNIAGRSRFIHLKRVPPEQMIHVDVDGVTFSIPARQFIIAISRGYAHETASKYCPPALSDILINLSKTKFVDDRKQYKRALLKRRIGKMLFFSLFIFISGMILSLMISAGSALPKINSPEVKNFGLSKTT